MPPRWTRPGGEGLLRSIPTATNAGKKLEPITGTPIDLLNMPKGCPFAPRCDAAMKICIREKAERIHVGGTHMAACWMNVKTGVDNGSILIDAVPEGGDRQ